MLGTQFKIRIGNDSRNVMGPGKAELLTMIDRLGSISAAAKHMKMSYSRAWALVDEMNKHFDTPLIMRSIGGSKGGGAQLSEFGRLILNSYHSILAKSETACSQEIDLINSHLRN